MMLLLAFALSAASPPDRWVNLGGSADKYEEYLDRESIRRAGDKVTLWTHDQFAGGQGVAWKEREFHCSRKTETILAYIRDDRGTVSHNEVRPHREASPILPGSVEERIFNLVCR